MASHSVFPVDRRYLMCDCSPRQQQPMTKAIYRLEGKTYKISHATVAFKLVAGVLARLFPGLGILDILGTAQDGAVQGEDPRSLQEL